MPPKLTDDEIARAKELILSSNRTSISYLQRSLGIGFNRAAMIVEHLEHEGFLSEPNERGVREIVNHNDIFKSTQEVLRKASEDEGFYKIFGYQNKQKFEAALAKYLQYSHLESFIEHFSYDLVCGAEMFFMRLEVLGFSESRLREVFNATRKRYDNILSLRGSSLSFASNFRRCDESIWTCMYIEAQHYLGVPWGASHNERKYMDLDTNEIIKLAIESIKEHIKLNQGKCKLKSATREIICDILYYKFVFKGREYYFNNNGDEIDSNEVERINSL